MGHMDSHQVPKNVTEFEFHLVGDMTLKQFAYLASGLGLAYLTFVMFAGSIPFIAWPLIVIFAASGISLAFLPIMERPLDHWLEAYVLAIFSPTQRKFESEQISTSHPAFNKRLQVYLSMFYPHQDTNIIPPKINTPQIASAMPQPSSVPVASPPPTPQAQSVPAEKATPVPTPAPVVPQVNTPAPPKPTAIPSSEQLHQSVELAQQSQIVQAKIIETQKVLDQIKARAVVPGVKSNQFTEQFQLTLAKLQQLTKQQAEISRKLALLSESHPNSSTSKRVVIVPQSAKSSDAQLILTTIPNMINGIVADSQGNYIEGVIVVTHDKQGLPVRALKSNKLGQFLAATPLENGSYNITLEKEGFNFDTLVINLDGSVISPIRVTAKQGVLNG